MREIVFRDLTQLGNDMVRLYQQVPEAEFRDYLDSLKSFEWTQVHVFDSKGDQLCSMSSPDGRRSRLRHKW